MNKSIATLDSPEFLNLTPLDINPLMSKCEIKVLYTGENRNHSFISEEVAAEMAKTLRGAPIVGYYKEQKEDFADHGNVVTFDDDGVHFECKTVPYGFVAPDADVWFQNFEDTDEFGNVEIRKYLMTVGYLWTGQFEEANLAVQGEGRPQSMELDEETLDGHWATNNKSGMDFFIINDAIFSKLCILGTDVEPCFEGASVTAPQVSTSFTMDDNFKNTLFSMMQELKNALQGGNTVDNIVKDTTDITATEFQAETQPEEVAPAAEPAEEVTPVEPAEVVTEAEPVVDNQTPDSFAAKKDDEEEDEDKKDPEASDDKDAKDDGEKEGSEDDANKSKDDEEDDEEKKKKYQLEQDFISLGNKYAELENQFAALQSEKESLETEVKELREFKLQVEEAKKDEMINSFYMLSDEDKKEVIENKSKYTLEEIESKLSVVCVRKKVTFALNDEEKNTLETKKEPLTFSLDSLEDDGATPAWDSAVRNNRK